MLKRVLGAALMLVAVTVAMPVGSAGAVAPKQVSPNSYEWPGCC